jgi:hypothetical protein
MLLFGLIDIYYLVMPHIPHDLGEFATYGEFAAKHAGDSPHLLDPSFVAMTAGVLMLVVGGAMKALSGQSLLAARDPSLRESLAFENM